MIVLLIYTVYRTFILISYLSGDGSSLMAKNTGQSDTDEEEYNGAPSVLKMKLILDGLLKNCPASHSLL